MSTTDIAIVLATICGHIFAVQAQKLIERSVAAQRRKVEIFTTMMANRERSLDPDRIRAMNSIELEFGAHRRFGLTFQSRLDKEITSAYRLYFDRLCENFDKKSSYAATWRDACTTLQVDLLLLMARRLGYNFDKAQISRGIYHPQGHVDLEEQQQEFRLRMIDLLAGKSSLPIDVRSMYVDPAFGMKQLEIQQALGDVLSGKTSISIVGKDHATSDGR